MNFTDQLVKHLKTDLEPSDSSYRMFNDGGVEVEVGEFLYGLVRMMKPSHILETGTHHGISAAYMAQALKDNYEQTAKDVPASMGLTTIEFLQPNFEIAKALFEKMGLAGFVKQVFGDVAKYYPENPDQTFDIIFLDTEPQTRFAELIKFFPALKPGGIVMIHDLHPHMHQIPNEEHGFAWPYGPLPAEIKGMMVKGELRQIHFRTPRGLTLFYKPAPDDYRPAF